MSNQAEWMENNEKHLMATIDWIQLRLQHLGQTADDDTEPKKKRGGVGRAKQSSQTDQDQNKAAINNETIELAQQKVIELEADNLKPALNLLANRLGLTKFEQHVLALCAAMELDTRIADLCANVPGNLNKPYPTFRLAFKLFDPPDWNALSPHAPLRHWRLLEINQPGAQPLTGAALAADERIVNYLKGLNYLDDRLVPLIDPMGLQPTDEVLPPSQQQAVDTIIGHIKQSNGVARAPVIELLGHDPASKRLIAGRTALALGLNLQAIDLKILPSQTGDFETFTRLWQRESLLMPLALYIEVDGIADAEKTKLKRFLQRSSGVVFLELEGAKTETVRNRVPVEVNKPTPEEQTQLWVDALQGQASDQPQRIGEQFSFSTDEIKRLAQEVLGKTSEKQIRFKPKSMANLSHCRTRRNGTTGTAHRRQGRLGPISTPARTKSHAASNYRPSFPT